MKLFLGSVKKLEGVPMLEIYEDEILRGPHEEARSDFWKAFKKAGRPACQVLGPNGNILRFNTTRGLTSFLSCLPQKWDYLSPGAYGGSSEKSRAVVYNNTFRDGNLIAAEAESGSRFVIFKGGVDRVNRL
jgi:hypothetical protein